jgi:ABC-type lipoprotein export system ATPase subunit
LTDSERAAARCGLIGFVFQHAALIERASALENVALAPWCVAVQILEQGENVFCALAIERPSRFVGKDQRRIVDKGACDGHALLLSPRQLPREMG